MTTTTWRPYQIGDKATIREGLEATLPTFVEEAGHTPTELVVHPTREDEARVAVADLCPVLPVRGVGGCLAWEIWLGVG
jgi:hypothetical protein